MSKLATPEGTRGRAKFSQEGEVTNRRPRYWMFSEDHDATTDSQRKAMDFRQDFFHGGSNLVDGAGGTRGPH